MASNPSPSPRTAAPAADGHEPAELRLDGWTVTAPEPAAEQVPSHETPREITQVSPEEESWWDRYKLVVAAVGTWTFLAIGLVIEYLTDLPHDYAVAAYIVAYLFGGTFATIAALKDLKNRQVNVDLLMVTAAIGAGVVGHWEEGAILLGLFSTSNALEHFALGRTQRAVRALMDMSPKVATVIDPRTPGSERVVPVEQLRVGDLVLVRPGEQIACDGLVVKGDSSVDQAPITGESTPVHKEPGDQVFAATMNVNGALEVRVTRLSTESTLAQIVKVVEDAQEQKSKTQRFTDAFEGKYTIFVLVFSTLVAVAPPLLFGKDWYDSFYKAMTLLVVASPCALVISTPSATLAGLANAARNGILFKGGGYLEDTGLVQTIAFDKTGTLTEGKPSLTDVIPVGDAWTEEEVLRVAASAERLSEHPLALAIVRGASDRAMDLAEATSFRAVTGKGLTATVDGREVVIGNDALFASMGIPLDGAAKIANDLRKQGKTAMLVGDRSGVHGVVAVADTLRPSATTVISDLHAMGITRTVMLTGDHQDVADAIAAQVGIDEVRAGLLPEEKLVVIEELMQDGAVAMIGDGVNDAPALATATVGIAMGGAGTDVALETADVVLMADDLTKLPYAISLSRRTRRTIIQNLAFSLVVIVTLVTAALTIGIPLPLGVVGHEGSTVIVVLNGLRLLRTPKG